MIEDATVDCYGEDEATSGFARMIEDSLKTPLMTVILGVEVEVAGIEQGENGHIVAICRRGRETQRILILDLPLPSPRPEGSEWIDAYRAWAQ